MTEKLPTLYCNPEITHRDETRNADLRQQAAFERARRAATPFARRRDTEVARQPVLCDAQLPSEAA